MNCCIMYISVTVQGYYELQLLQLSCYKIYVYWQPEVEFTKNKTYTLNKILWQYIRAYSQKSTRMAVKTTTSLAEPKTPWDERVIIFISSCSRHRVFTVFPKGVAGVSGRWEKVV